MLILALGYAKYKLGQQCFMKKQYGLTKGVFTRMSLA